MGTGRRRAHDGHMTTYHTTPGEPSSDEDENRHAPPLRRPAHGRMLAGVAAGLADSLDLDVALVRVVLVVLVCFGGIGLPLYLAGWLLIPDEDAAQSVGEHWLAHLGQRV
jgi:phage shock protein PspC (stress-responsive transcriptional regulator)